MSDDTLVVPGVSFRLPDGTIVPEKYIPGLLVKYLAANRARVQPNVAEAADASEFAHQFYEEVVKATRNRELCMEQLEAYLVLNSSTTGIATVLDNDVPPNSRCAKHGKRRCRVAPTARHCSWSVLVDTCPRCGIMRPVEPTDYVKRQWLKRWNSRRR